MYVAPGHITVLRNPNQRPVSSVFTLYKRANQGSLPHHNNEEILHFKVKHCPTIPGMCACVVTIVTRQPGHQPEVVNDHVIAAVTQ